MQNENQAEDLNQQEYQQRDSIKLIWKAMQNLKLGADKDRWLVHEDAQREFEKDHRLCLVAKGLNPHHQNSAGMKAELPQLWELEGKVIGQVNDDRTVNFYFKSEHHLVMVLEKQPHNYRGCIVALERWRYMTYPNFLRHIPFKVCIFKLLDIYRRPRIVTSIGSKLGHVAEVYIVEPTINREAAVWIKFLFDVYDVIILTNSVEIIKGKPPVELDFRYAGLQKFCTLCGSLQHEYELCKDYPLLSRRQFELMDIGTNPYKTVEERNAAIGE
ncbi:hypothetical protein Bca4012_027495 [Brassica carinata]